MRLLKRKIVVKDSVSRYNGTVPGAVKIWKTPVGDYMSRKEAELAIMQTGYQLDAIKMGFTYENIDITKDPQGNYGLIPFNVTLSAITSSPELSGDTIAYSTLMEWYGYLKKYNEIVGNDGTAEKHYLLETSSEDISPQHLQEAQSEDERVREIKKVFGDKDPIEWIEDNLLGKSNNTTTVKGVFSESENVFDRGYFNMPLLITSNIDDMGQMAAFDDTHEPDDYHNAEDEVYDYKLGEIYTKPIFVNDEGVVQLDSDYIIMQFVDENNRTVAELTAGPVSAKTDYSSYELVDFGKTTYEDSGVTAYGMSYYDWLMLWNKMYDVENSDMTDTGELPINYSPLNIAHDIDGNIIPFDGELSAPEYITKTYQLESPSEYGFFEINGVTYDIKKNLFVTYNDESSPFYEMEFPVYEIAKNGSTKTILYYTIINGKKYIGTMENVNGVMKPCFYFKKPNGCEKTDPSYPDDDKKLYIEYDGAYIFLDSNERTITLKDVKIEEVSVITDIRIYKRLKFKTQVSGNTYYVTYENEGFLSKLADDIVTQNGDNYTVTQNFVVDEHVEGAILIEVDILDAEARLTFQNEFESTSFITGYTVSRLHMVRDMEITTDAIGNQMPGIFNLEYDYKAEKYGRYDSKFVNSKFNEPYDGMLLEIPYHISNSNEVEHVNGLVKGDVLSELLLIPYDSDGEEINLEDINLWLESMELPTISKNKFYADRNLTVDDVYVNLAEEVVKPLFSFTGTSSVKMSVKYQIGAELRTVKLRNGLTETSVKRYYPRSTGDTISAGVVYTEVFNVVEATCKYNSSESNANILSYYKLEPEMKRNYQNNDFENVVETESQAKFSLAVDMFGRNGSTIWANSLPGTDVTTGDYKFNLTNGDTLAPVYRKETMFGVSIPQNIDDNIYIDRGMNGLFEKQMKLNEAKSLDALTLYGNKWFKIDEAD